MAKPPVSPDVLLQVAVSKERRLTAKERRFVLAYLMERKIDPEAKAYRSNYQLAALFGVNETTIRNDKAKIFREYSSQITPDRAIAFVTDALKAQDRLIRRAESALVDCQSGSLAEREYIELLDKLEARRFKIVQDIGIVAKELGRLQVAEETWEATVNEDGVTSVSQVAMTPDVVST